MRLCPSAERYHLIEETVLTKVNVIPKESVVIDKMTKEQFICQVKKQYNYANNRCLA